MRLIFLTALLFHMFSELSYAQARNIDSLEHRYRIFFDQGRKDIYLHLNKEVFFEGESIWFAAYILNHKTGRLTADNTNLYCGLYDSDGRLLEKKVFYAEKGFVNARFLMKPEYGEGQFYIKVSSSPKEQKSSNDSVVRSIFVMDRETSAHFQVEKSVNDEISVMPEGGRLITGVKNNIGFMLSNHSYGSQFEGEVFLTDHKGGIIERNLPYNESGIGKFTFIPKNGERYHINFKNGNGDVKTRTLPESGANGSAININILPENNVFLSMEFNRDFFESIKGKNYYVSLHRDGKIKTIPIVVNHQKITFSFKKEDIIPGLNIITIFDDKLQAIAERLFYNGQNAYDESTDIKFDIEKQTGDSISLKFKNLKNMPISTVSIAIVPEDSKMDYSQNNILSYSKIERYLSNDLNRSIVPFLKSTKRKDLYELDLILLNSGPSNYNWDQILKSSIEGQFSDDNGFRIKGKLIHPKKSEKNNIILYQRKVGNLMTANISKDNTFEYSNAYLISGDSLNFGLSGKHNILQKPKFEIEFFPKLDMSDRLKISDYNIPTYVLAEKKAFNDTLSQDILIDDGTILLDDVTITGKIESNLTRNPGLAKGIFEAKSIGEKDIKKNRLLSRYIRSLGFKVSLDPNSGFFSIASRTAFDSPPIVWVDGFRVEGPIRDSQLISIDEVYYEHFGTQGSNGGTIYIYRKSGEDLVLKRNLFFKIMPTIGFEPYADFVNLKLTNSLDKQFLNFGIVHWHTSFQSLGEDGAISFPHFNLKGVKVNIQGITDDGTLISTTQLIPLN